MNERKKSDSRLLLGAVLVILSVIVSYAVFYAIADTLVYHAHFYELRVLVGTVILLILLAGACMAISDVSVSWQVLLGSFSLAAIYVGIRVIVVAAVYKWHLLFGALGLKALLSISAGAGAAYLMWRLQDRFLPGGRAYRRHARHSPKQTR